MATTPKSPPPAKDGVYRRGFGMKAEIAGELAEDYHSHLVEELREAGYRKIFGGIEIRLAKEFGFCYGVDKAVDFAYETRRKFPDRKIYLTAEIIHNPRVNARMMEMGIEFLSGQYATADYEDIKADDVVILPAFGVAIAEIDRLRKTGCVMVDTTCGSVVHVWKRVEQYVRAGFTSLIHGKHRHEETIATASYAIEEGRGGYIIVFNKDEAKLVCDAIRDPARGSGLANIFAEKVSDDFDFERDLERIGVANQTTMLSSDSLEIAGMVREAMIDRYGEERLDDHFRSFDTICHATQERQDAVVEMMAEPPDIMIVIGGFNSSNTNHLHEIASPRCPTYHVEGAEGLLSAARIRHKPRGFGSNPIESDSWLPDHRPLSIGVTAGASTPNRVIGEVIEKLAAWA